MVVLNYSSSEKFRKIIRKAFARELILSKVSNFCWVQYITPFLANVLILYPLKTQKNRSFFCVLRDIKLGTLAKNALKVLSWEIGEIYSYSVLLVFWRFSTKLFRIPKRAVSKFFLLNLNQSRRSILWVMSTAFFRFAKPLIPNKHCSRVFVRSQESWLAKRRGLSNSYKPSHDAFFAN